MIYGLSVLTRILIAVYSCNDESTEWGSICSFNKSYTVVQTVDGNGNRDIRGETRAEYQGRQERQKGGRYQSKTRETIQSQNTMLKQRKLKPLRNVSRGNIGLRNECVCECGLSTPIDEHQVN